MTDVAQVSAPLPATPPPATAGTDPAHLWKDKSFGFHDLLDIINPLQHIPIIATVYRYLTGDTIGNVARVAGDALYGGPIGMAAGVVSAGVEIETGKDIGDHVVALLTGGDDVPAGPGTIMIAAASPAERPVVTAAATMRPAAAASFSRPAAKMPVPAIDDPRQAFIARVEAKRQQNTGDGRTLNSRVVPLEGTAGSLVQRRVIGSPFTAAPAGTPPRSIAQAADAAAPPAIRASLATSDGPAAPTSALPGNPPINISQQMLDALDKYARMAQQKRADDKRGAQLDMVH